MLKDVNKKKRTGTKKHTMIKHPELPIASVRRHHVGPYKPYCPVAFSAGSKSPVKTLSKNETKYSLRNRVEVPETNKPDTNEHSDKEDVGIDFSVEKSDHAQDVSSHSVINVDEVDILQADGNIQAQQQQRRDEVLVNEDDEEEVSEVVQELVDQNAGENAVIVESIHQGVVYEEEKEEVVVAECDINEEEDNLVSPPSSPKPSTALTIGPIDLIEDSESCDSIDNKLSIRHLLEQLPEQKTSENPTVPSIDSGYVCYNVTNELNEMELSKTVLDESTATNDNDNNGLGELPTKKVINVVKTYTKAGYELRQFQIVLQDYFKKSEKENIDIENFATHFRSRSTPSSRTKKAEKSSKQRNSTHVIKTVTTNFGESYGESFEDEVAKKLASVRKYQHSRLSLLLEPLNGSHSSSSPSSTVMANSQSASSATRTPTKTNEQSNKRISDSPLRGAMSTKTASPSIKMPIHPRTKLNNLLMNASTSTATTTSPSKSSPRESLLTNISPNKSSPAKSLLSNYSPRKSLLLNSPTRSLLLERPYHKSTVRATVMDLVSDSESTISCSRHSSASELDTSASKTKVKVEATDNDSGDEPRSSLPPDENVNYSINTTVKQEHVKSEEKYKSYYIESDDDELADILEAYQYVERRRRKVSSKGRVESFTITQSPSPSKPSLAQYFSPKRRRMTPDYRQDETDTPTRRHKPINAIPAQVPHVNVVRLEEETIEKLIKCCRTKDPWNDNVSLQNAGMSLYDINRLCISSLRIPTKDAKYKLRQFMKKNIKFESKVNGNLTHTKSNLSKAERLEKRKARQKAKDEAKEKDLESIRRSLLKINSRYLSQRKFWCYIQKGSSSSHPIVL